MAKIFQNNRVYDAIILSKILGRNDTDIGCALTDMLGRKVSVDQVCRIRKGAKYQARANELHGLLERVLRIQVRLREFQGLLDQVLVVNQTEGVD